jgi:hypothetical protein
MNVLNDWSLNLFKELKVKLSNKRDTNNLTQICIDGKRLRNYQCEDPDSNIQHINAFVANLNRTIRSIVTTKLKGSRIRYPNDRSDCKDINSKRSPSKGEAFI